ncbi:MAG: hypothetical protein ACI9SQ_000969 [Rubritalea sp.]|jgi:hypothetical protein
MLLLSPISFAALSNHSIKRSIQYHCEDGIRYGVFSSTLVYRNFDGRLIVLNFNISKLNNWNRVLYLENKDGRFSRYDNGVIEEADSDNPLYK